MPEPVIRQFLTIPNCVRCGWNYDDNLLAQYARGEIRLDPTPTHMCKPVEPVITRENTPVMIVQKGVNYPLVSSVCPGCDDVVDLLRPWLYDVYRIAGDSANGYEAGHVACMK